MRAIISYGDMIHYLRKKARWGAGRAVLRLQGAQLVRAPQPVTVTASAPKAGAAPETHAEAASPKAKK